MVVVAAGVLGLLVDHSVREYVLKMTNETWCFSFEEVDNDLDYLEETSLFSFDDGSDIHQQQHRNLQLTKSHLNIRSKRQNPKQTEQLPSTITSNKIIKQKKKRIRPYKPRTRVYMPKLVKDDQRRLYATMYTNVFNAGDYNLWSSYFKTYFHKNMTFREEGPLFYAHAPKIIELRGGDACCDFIFTRMLNLPDMTLRILDTKISLPPHSTNKQGGETIIVSTFLLEGTRLYEVASDKLILTKDEEFGSNDSGGGGGGGGEMTQNYHSRIELTASSDCSEDSDNNRNKNDSVSSSSRPMCHSGGATSGEFSGCSNTGDNTGVEVSFVVDYESQKGSKGKIQGYSVENYMELLAISPVLKRPVHTRMEGAFTLRLDQHRMITQLLFDTMITETRLMRE